MDITLIAYLFIWLSLSTVVSATLKPDCYIARLDDQSLAECGNRGYAMRCNNSDLLSIPREYPHLTNQSDVFPPLCLLDLSYNDFYVVGNQSFVGAKHLNSSDVLWLYLDNSNISKLASHAFVNLTNLLYLNLSGNHLHRVDSFGLGVFKPLVSLKNINLKRNKFGSFDVVGKELIYLKNLTGLFIDLCPDCVFGADFHMLPNLVNLTLSGRTKNSCNAPYVRKETFQYVTGVQRLHMSSCQIRNISELAFKPLVNLVLLDISYNQYLTFQGMNTALYGLRNSSTLKILDVKRLHILGETGIELRRSDIENLKTLNALQNLYMDLNKIEVFEDMIFRPYQFPTSIRVFTLSGNRLTDGKYTSYLHHVTNVTYLDISRQHLNFDPFLNAYDVSQKETNVKYDLQNLPEDENCPGICAVCLPASFKKLIYRQSFVRINIDRPLAFCGAGGLKYLDVSFNLIFSWNGVIFGLDNLTYLDLSDNYCTMATPNFFLNLVSLEHLNISGNILGSSFDPAVNQNASKMFKWQQKLKILDMSFNKIASLPKDVFVSLTNLEQLYLSGNLIDKWNCTLNTRVLRILDLSGNKMFDLPSNLTTYLDSLVEDMKENETITVNLSANPLECSCKTIPFLKWLRFSRVAVNFRSWDSCRLDGYSYRFGSNENLEKIINQLETDTCVNKSWVNWVIGATCCVFTAILSFVVCFVTYKNRWKLRYMYYSRNRRYRHEGFERLFEKDAFVSYAKNNASFIKNHMISALEERHDLRLWVADRDASLGNSIAENICHGINNSRKSVLLVNKAYLDDEWCNYEMNMAQEESVHTKRKMIIIVLTEHIPTEKLPISIIKLLRSERSMEFPEHEDNLGTFWTNLADEINSCPE